MSTSLIAATTSDLAKDDLIVSGGAGGFIGSSLARYFHDQGFACILTIDKKPLHEWYQHMAGVKSLCLDLSEYENCVRACDGVTEIYNWRQIWGAWASFNGFASNACETSLSIRI
jgi:nucleoside-diphosphate-sugar epimerase